MKTGKFPEVRRNAKSQLGFFFILIGGKGDVGSSDQSHDEGGRSHALLLTLN